MLYKKQKKVHTTSIPKRNIILILPCLPQDDTKKCGCGGFCGLLLTKKPKYYIIQGMGVSAKKTEPAE